MVIDAKVNKENNLIVSEKWINAKTKLGKKKE